MAHKGKGTVPEIMLPVEIMREHPHLTLTEQRKQPAWFMELVIKDMQVKRLTDKAAIKKANKASKPKRRGR